MLPPHPVQEHYRIQARRRTLLTVVMVFLAVATAVWSGLARRGSSNIDLKSERSDVFDEAGKQDDPFSQLPGTASPEATSTAIIGSNPAVGQVASSGDAGITPIGAAQGTTLRTASPFGLSPLAGANDHFGSFGPTSTSAGAGAGARVARRGGGAGGAGGGGIGGGGGGNQSPRIRIERRHRSRI